MAWHNAPSVAAGLAEATRRWPHRSRASDGTVGDAAHAARHSDHNPDSRGVVHAFDLTHDPAHGVDCEQLAAHLVSRRDPRVKYLIWNRRICNSSDWTWRPYTGQNPHTKHLHVSIKSTQAAEDDTSAWWDLGQAGPAGQAQALGAALGLLLGPDVAEGVTALLALADVLAAGLTPAQPPAPAAPPAPPGGPLLPGHNRPVPPGYRRFRKGEKTPKAVVQKANEILHSSQPIGTQTPLTIDGKEYLFAVEWHKHAATDHVPDNLKHWHRGVTVYPRDS
jgi:hypothetical protein